MLAAAVVGCIRKFVHQQYTWLTGVFIPVFRPVLLARATAVTTTNMPSVSTLYHLLGVAGNAAPQAIQRRYYQFVLLYLSGRNGV